MVSRFTVLLFALLAALLLAACTDGRIGIYAQIESEERIGDATDSLENDTTIGGVTAAGNFFYAGTAELKRRDKDGIEWTQVRPPDTQIIAQSAGGPPRSLDVASADGAVYAVFGSSDGTDTALVRGAADLSPDSPAWQEIDVAAAFPDRSVRLSSVWSVPSGSSDIVFVSVALEPTGSEAARSYNLAVVDGTGARRILASSLASPVEGVAYGQGNYWYVGATGVYVSSSPAGSLPASDSGTAFASGDTDADETGLFTDVLSAGNGNLFFATSSGRLFRFDGADWATYERTVDGQTSNAFTIQGSVVPFTVLGEVDASQFRIVVVGSRGTGYFEVDPDSLVPSEPSLAGNYVSSPLDQGHITSFFVSPSENNEPVLFAGTASLGLWRNLYDRRETNWVQE